MVRTVPLLTSSSAIRNRWESKQNSYEQETCMSLHRTIQTMQGHGTADK